MKAILRIGFIVLAIMALVVPANAGPYEDGLAAEDRYDYAGALRLWLLLAEQGHAYYSLGVMYRSGKGVPKDPILAHMWFNLAAVQMSSLGQVRDELAELMTPPQIAEAQRMAREWMAKHQQ